MVSNADFSPYLHIKFDASGTPYDASTNQHTLTLIGSPDPGPVALNGSKSAYFDSNDSFKLDFATSTLSSYDGLIPENTFTVVAWVKPTLTTNAFGTGQFDGANSQNSRWIWLGDNPNTENQNAASFNVSFGTNGIYVAEHGYHNSSRRAFATGTYNGWTHVAVVIDINQTVHGSDYTLFLNGQQVATGSQVDSKIYAPVGVGPFSPGGMTYAEADDPLGAWLGEMAIMPSALTSQNILDLYNERAPGLVWQTYTVTDKDSVTVYQGGGGGGEEAPAETVYPKVYGDYRLEDEAEATSEGITLGVFNEFEYQELLFVNKEDIHKTWLLAASLDLRVTTNNPYEDIYSFRAYEIQDATEEVPEISFIDVKYHVEQRPSNDGNAWANMELIQTAEDEVLVFVMQRYEDFISSYNYEYLEDVDIFKLTRSGNTLDVQRLYHEHYTTQTEGDVVAGRMAEVELLPNGDFRMLSTLARVPDQGNSNVTSGWTGIVYRDFSYDGDETITPLTTPGDDRWDISFEFFETITGGSKYGPAFADSYIIRLHKFNERDIYLIVYSNSRTSGGEHEYMAVVNATSMTLVDDIRTDLNAGLSFFATFWPQHQHYLQVDHSYYEDQENGVVYYLNAATNDSPVYYGYGDKLVIGKVSLDSSNNITWDGDHAILDPPPGFNVDPGSGDDAGYVLFLDYREIDNEFVICQTIVSDTTYWDTGDLADEPMPYVFMYYDGTTFAFKSFVEVDGTQANGVLVETGFRPSEANVIYQDGLYDSYMFFGWSYAYDSEDQYGFSEDQYQNLVLVKDKATCYIPTRGSLTPVTPSGGGQDATSAIAHGSIGT